MGSESKGTVLHGGGDVASEREERRRPALFALLMQGETPGRGVALPTLRAPLPSSVNAV